MVLKKTVGKVLLLANYTAVILLILVYLSVYVDPNIFWPAALLGLTYPYILLINIIFVLFWLFRKNKYALISGLVIILGWGHLTSYIRFSMGSNDAGLKDKTKILSYNVKAVSLKYYPKDKLKMVSDFVNKEEPDIVCYQELFFGNQIQNIPQSLIGNYQLRNSVVSPNGMMIFSKYPRISKGIVHFKNSHNLFIYGDFLIGGDTIRVYNTHLQSVKLGFSDLDIVDSIVVLENNHRYEHVKRISRKLIVAFKKRSEQVKILEDHIISSPYKTILCGDFNDTPVSYTYNTFSKILVDSYKEKGSGIGKTLENKKMPYRIDYVFHDEHFKALSYKRVKMYASDHFPIVVELGVTDN